MQPTIGKHKEQAVINRLRPKIYRPQSTSPLTQERAQGVVGVHPPYGHVTNKIYYVLLIPNKIYVIIIIYWEQTYLSTYANFSIFFFRNLYIITFLDLLCITIIGEG